jgi:hypothetical protein
MRPRLTRPEREMPFLIPRLGSDASSATAAAEVAAEAAEAALTVRVWDMAVGHEDSGGAGAGDAVDDAELVRTLGAPRDELMVRMHWGKPKRAYTAGGRLTCLLDCLQARVSVSATAASDGACRDDDCRGRRGRNRRYHPIAEPPATLHDDLSPSRGGIGSGRHRARRGCHVGHCAGGPYSGAVQVPARHALLSDRRHAFDRHRQCLL